MTDSITIPPCRTGQAKRDVLVGFHIHVLYEDYSAFNTHYWSQEPATEVLATFDTFTRDDRVRSVVLRRRHRIYKTYDRDEERRNAPLGSNKLFSLMR